jgi:hypothetical protein
MKRLDLIIDALDRVDTFDWNQQDNKLIKDALTAARELRAMKPVAYLYRYQEGWVKELRHEGVDPIEVKKLYALGDEK